MEVRFQAWPLPSRNAAWTKGEAAQLGITEQQPPEFFDSHSEMGGMVIFFKEIHY